MKNETITTPLTDRQLIDEGRGYAHTINAAFCRKIELRMHAAEAELAAERARLDWLLSESAHSLDRLDCWSRFDIDAILDAEGEHE
jgi:hypothetical protein